METICDVEFSLANLKKIVKKTHACIVWGGGLGIVPADSKIIRIEKLLKLDPQAQLLASIMSKKLAMGSKYILIDIPFGKTAKVTKQEAFVIKKKFEHLGKYFNKKLRVVLTDGENPIGKGIGPLLELIDVIKILDPGLEGPKDLEEKSLFLAGQLFEMTDKAKKGQGEKLAREILSSGKAWNKFKEIIKAQGGNVKELGNLKPDKFRKDITVKRSAIVSSFNNYRMAALARIAGSPIDKGAGLYIHVMKNEKLSRGDKLLTIYSNSKSRLKEAIKFYHLNKPIELK